MCGDNELELTMRFLFFPLEVGIAHVARSLALAEELQKTGHDIVVALPRIKQSLFASSKVQMIDISPVSPIQNIRAINTFKNKDKVAEMIEHEKKLLKKYKPDYCVVDFRLSGVVSAAQLNIPIMYITGSGGLPFGCQLPNPGWAGAIDDMSKPLINYVVQHMKYQYFKVLQQASAKTGEALDINSILEKVHYIIPEIPSYLPSLRHDLHISYTGPLMWDGFKTKKPEWMHEIEPDGKTVYLTFGGTGFDKRKLIKLAHHLLEEGLRVVVSSSFIADPHEFPKNKNLFVERYISGLDISKRVDAVICHGGYGTVTEAALAGKPVISIPFNPDQSLHALRFKELHLGEIAVKFGLKDFIHLSQNDWLKFEMIGKSASVNNVVKIVKKVLSRPEYYRSHIKDFSQKLEEQRSQFNVRELF